MVDAAHGTIDVNSIPMQGTSFVIRLPIHAEPHPSIDMDVHTPNEAQASLAKR